MKRLRRLDIPHAEAILAPSSGLQRPARQKVDAASAVIAAEWDRYLALAPHHQLHLLPHCDRGRPEQVIIGRLTKGELVALYTDHMADQRAYGRSLYDRIMLLAPNGICPYCGFGHVKTLDHFLSKSFYPTFSVMPANLVPSCRDCNTPKSAKVVELAEQTMHPYFEEVAIENEDWLFGEIVAGATASIRYWAQPPANWAPDLATRLMNHFRDFDLASRLSVQACTELSSLGGRLEGFPTPELRATHLRESAETERQLQRNSWKTALYEAAQQSAWFCTDGFRAPAQVQRGP